MNFVGVKDGTILYYVNEEIPREVTFHSFDGQLATITFNDTGRTDKCLPDGLVTTLDEGQ